VLAKPRVDLSFKGWRFVAGLEPNEPDVGFIGGDVGAGRLKILLRVQR
jgi:hypothetical protein